MTPQHVHPESMRCNVMCPAHPNTVKRGTDARFDCPEPLDDLIEADASRARAELALRRSAVLEVLPQQQALIRAVRELLMEANDPHERSLAYHTAIRGRQQREWPMFWEKMRALENAFVAATEGDIDLVKQYLDRQQQ